VDARCPRHPERAMGGRLTNLEKDLISIIGKCIKRDLDLAPARDRDRSVVSDGNGKIRSSIPSPAISPRAGARKKNSRCNG